MILSALLAAAITTGAAPESAADRITLRDGKILLGQVVESAPKGNTLVIVRRGWAEANLPDWSKRWQAAEAPRRKQGRAQRLDRLNAWRPERARTAGKDDAILDWIDAEIARLRADFDPAEAPLMTVALTRAEIKKVASMASADQTMLRQAWIAGLENPEELSPDDLRVALKKAFVSAIGEGEAPVEELLPEPIESDNRWRLRRAATEVTFDGGPRFVRYENLLLPEGQEPGLADAQQALTGLLGDLLGDRPAADPLAEKLRAVEAEGKVGAIVTRLTLGDASAVESTLWVRTLNQGWKPALTKQAAARPGDVAANAGDALADDPQVKSAFAALEGLGLGQIGDDARRLSLRSGAAVQKALGEARGALSDEIRPAVLPIRSGLRPKKPRADP